MTDQHIPLAYKAPCSLHLDGCTGWLHTKADGNGFKVTGFDVNRNQGGANVITLKESVLNDDGTRIWACAACIRMTKLFGKHGDQKGMFD